MANVNNPFGARIIRSLFSDEISSEKYVTASSDATPIYMGDFVSTTGAFDSDGNPVCTKANTYDPMVGIVIGFEQQYTASGQNITYRKASTTRTVYVCDDPYIVFEMQVNGTLTAADARQNANIVLGTPNNAIGKSGTQINLNTLTTQTAQLKILGLSPKVNNELGQYSVVLAMIHEHELQHATSSSIPDTIWQDKVNSETNFTTSEPASPTIHDRYINTTTGTSSVTSQSVTADYIYEWGGSRWDETAAEEGMMTYIDDTNLYESFDGTTWSDTGGFVNHNSTLNKQGGTATEYYHLTATEHGYVSGANAQSLLTTASPTFVNGHFTGKLTVDGAIDPTALLLDAQASAPFTDNGTIYYSSATNNFQFRENGAWTTLTTYSTFAALTDVTGAYTTANALYRTNAAANGYEETTTLLTESVEENQFTFSRGTIDLVVSTDCTINQDLSNSSDVSFNSIVLPINGTILFNLTTGTIGGYGGAAALGLTFTFGDLMPGLTEINVAPYGGALSIDWELLNSITVAGTSGATTDFLTFNNSTAAITSSGTGMLFNFTASDTNVYDAARIAAIAEGTWTGTAASQDSYLSIQTALNGTVSEKLRVDPNGALLATGGTLTIGGVGGSNNENLVFDFETGPNSVTVTSTTGTALIYWNELLPQITLTGTVENTVDFIIFDNIVTHAAMTNTGTGIQFLQRALGGSTSIESGRLGIYTEGNWVHGTASSIDSYMSFQTCENGTVSEKMRISSAGKITNAAQAPTATSSYLTIDASGADTTNTGVLNQGIAIVNTNATTDNTVGLFFNNALDTPLASIVCKYIDRSSGNEDTNLVFNTTFNGTLGSSVIIDSSGFIGIGTGAVGSLGNPFNIKAAGSAGSQKIFQVITNSVQATADTESAIYFEHHASDDNNYGSGMISVSTVGTWTATGTSQDSYMSLKTVINQSLTERLRIQSDGSVLYKQTGTIQFFTYEGSVADDATVSLPDATSGFVLVNFDEGTDYAIASFTDAAVVTLVANSASVVNTDTDTKYCIFDGGTSVSVRNRIGAAKNIKIQCWSY